MSSKFSIELILEQLARNRVFLGDGGLQKVRDAFVIVVGCGGVGSWAATMLVRSGVGRVRFIDFDQVTLSSLNRHAVATLADVGTPKVLALRKHLEQVAPWVDIDARNELWNKENGETLLDGEPTFVVDAIDNIDTKVDLLHYCKMKGIPVISSMGAGCKSDPTRVSRRQSVWTFMCLSHLQVNIGDISESNEDPLSRSTRRRLRQKGVTTGISVVYSLEKPAPGKASLLPLANEEFEKGKVDELGVLPTFRARILPVLGTMPGLFGLCVANHILTHIAGYPMEYSQGKNRTKLYEDIQARLAGQESRLRGNIIGLRLALTEADIGYVVEEVFKGRSVVSGIPTRLMLTRWEPLPFCHKEDGFWAENDHRLGIDDVVLMTKEEAKKHEQEVLICRKSPEDVWGNEVVEKVRQRRNEEASYAKYR
jgi:tRNA A37 threonylcarbamoyladenosine dehydratase